MFAKANIERGEPLLEYRGEHLSKSAAEERRSNYKATNRPLCFIYELTHIGLETFISSKKLQDVSNAIIFKYLSRIFEYASIFLCVIVPPDVLIVIHFALIIILACFKLCLVNNCLIDLKITKMI